MQSFERYIAAGGGLLVYHAALSAFPEWQQFNRMIGLGGWGGRKQDAGPYVYFSNGRQVKEGGPGNPGHHGTQHPFQIAIRNSHHPITRGLPAAWMHDTDELYDRLRGPAKDLTILATAFSAPESGGTGRDEPVLWTVKYQRGRIAAIALGHDAQSAAAADFAVLLQRSAEWSATGRVTSGVPPDFPAAVTAASLVEK